MRKRNEDGNMPRMDFDRFSRRELQHYYMNSMRPILDKNALYSDTTAEYLIPPEPNPYTEVTIRFRAAKNNIDKFRIKNGTVKNQNIKDGIDENNIDLVFLDLPKPFEIFEEVWDSLNVGGWLAVYAPYIDQAKLAYRVANKLGFYDIEIIELLERGLEIRQQGVRPKTRMVGHSGYLVFARKL